MQTNWIRTADPQTPGLAPRCGAVPRAKTGGEMAKSRQPVERLSFSVAETAEALGISVRYARILVKDGTIPSFRLGGRVFVSIEELRRLTGARSTCPGKPAA